MISDQLSSYKHYSFFGLSSLSHGLMDKKKKSSEKIYICLGLAQQYWCLAKGNNILEMASIKTLVGYLGNMSQKIAEIELPSRIFLKCTCVKNKKN